MKNNLSTIPLPSLFGYGLAALLAAASPPAAAAIQTLSSTDFTGFATGISVAGQGGWGIGMTTPNIVVDETVVAEAGGNVVFRLSNAVTSGDINDIPFAPRPAGIPNFPGDTISNPVLGSPELFAGEASTTASHRRFYASFQFKSATGAAQPGLFISVSADNGAGGRMSYVGLEDTGAGIDLITYDIDAAGDFGGAQTIASGLSYSDWHEVAFEILFQEGPSNDVVTFYLDGSPIHTGTTWEAYFAATQASSYPLGVPVQTLLFNVGGSAVPANSGNGYYFDNVLIQVGEAPTTIPTLSQWAQLLLGLGVLAVGGWRYRASGEAV